MISWLLGIILIQAVVLIGIALILYQFRRHRRFIGSLNSDLQKPVITPELIKSWKKTIKTLTPNTPKWRAYQQSLKNVGEWDGD